MERRSGEKGVEAHSENLKATVLLMRHDEYDTRFPEGEDAEGIAEKSGKLTEQGVAHTREVVRRKIQKLLSLGEPLDIIFVHSPTRWENTDKQLFGSRAEHTALVAASEVGEVYREQSLDDPQGIAGASGVLCFEYSQTPSDYSMRLVEPNIHYVHKAEEEGKNPKAFIEGLTEEATLAGVKRWEFYHNQQYSERLETVRRDIKAESSGDVGSRVLAEITDLESYAKLNGWYVPGRNLVFWLVSHNDSLRALVQHEMGAGEKAAGYEPGLSEIMELKIENHKLETTFKGEQYEKELAA